MRLKIQLLLIIVFLSACSVKTPPNQWEYKSAKAFGSYTKYFLGSNEVLAKDSLKTAVKHAKLSGDLNQLARIYLGECALNISVGEMDTCVKYKNIKDLVDSNELEAYYHMLQKSLTSEEIAYLPKQYRAFAASYGSKKYDGAFEHIMSMDELTSKFIAASLIKESLNKEKIEYLIETASFPGYKKLVVFWLENLENLEDDPHKKEKIRKKIGILKG